LTVVFLSSGYVLRTTAQRVRLTPSAEAACPRALRTISAQQATDFPEPNGPMTTRRRAEEFRKSRMMGPDGL